MNYNLNIVGVDKVNNSKKKTSKISFIISIALAIIIVLAYVFVFTKDKDKLKDKNEITENYKLEVYKDNVNNYYCEEKSSYCNTLGFTIEVKNKDSKILDFDNNYLYMLYNDNGLFIYDIKNKTKKSISLGNNYQYYRFILMNLIYMESFIVI